jgi:hypothetical protein
MTVRKMKFAWKYRRPLWKYRKALAHRREIAAALLIGVGSVAFAIFNLQGRGASREVAQAEANPS